MRQWITLLEKFHHGFQATWSKTPCEVFKNPDRREFAQIKNKADDVRAWLVGEDILVWNTYSALHQNVREELKLPDTSIPIMIYGDPGDEGGVLVTDASRSTQWWHDGNVVGAIRAHPYMQSFTYLEINYYDEAIVGSWDDPSFGHDDEDEEDEDEEGLDESQSWFHTVKYGADEHDILKNPSRAEVFKMINADQFKQVRAICTPEDVYVFTADMSHGEVQQDLGWDLWDKARIFIDRNGPYLNASDDMAVSGTDQDYEDENERAHNAAQLKMVLDWCTAHPVLKRWFPGYTLGKR